MGEFRRYPKSHARTIVDFTALLAKLETGQEVVLCISVALLDIIRKLLKDRGLWLTTYALSYDDVGYVTPNSVEFEPIRNEIAEFLGETNEMKCDDLISALRSVALAIRQSACCDGQSPQGAPVNVEPGPNGEIYYGNQSPSIGKPEDPTSVGFESQEAYNEYMCKFANTLVEGLILTLRNFASLTAESILFGAGAAMVIFVANPPLAVIVALVVAGLTWVFLLELANQIETDKEDWVCLVYNHTDYVDLIARIDQKVAQTVDGTNLEPFTGLLQSLFHGLVTTDVVDQAYSPQNIPALSNAVDCDTCDQGSCEEIDGLYDLYAVDIGSGIWQLNLKDAIAASNGWSVSSIEDLQIRFKSGGTANLIDWAGPGPGNFVAGVIFCNDSQTQLLSPPLSGPNMSAWEGGYKNGYINGTQEFHLEVELECFDDCA